MAASNMATFIKGSDNITRPIAATLYGTCATAVNVGEKAVVCEAFDAFVTGMTITVKFTNSNTASTPTLNINSKGAKAIYKYGTTKPGTTPSESWSAGAVVSFTYDGTNWIMNDINEQAAASSGASFSGSGVVFSAGASYSGSGVVIG